MTTSTFAQNLQAGTLLMMPCSQAPSTIKQLHTTIKSSTQLYAWQNESLFSNTVITHLLTTVDDYVPSSPSCSLPQQLHHDYTLKYNMMEFILIFWFFLTLKNLKLTLLQQGSRNYGGKGGTGPPASCCNCKIMEDFNCHS